MTHLPRNLYRAAQVKELDRLAIESSGLSGVELMERAGLAAFEVLQHCWPQARNITVICGPGNNGGDGFVVARLAAAAGMAVEVVLATDAERLSGAAAQAFATMMDAGLSCTESSLKAVGHDKQADVIVDALFGTGLERPLEGDIAAMISALNASQIPVLAIDIPSGVHADNGQVLGQAVRATATVSFIGLKQGLVTGQGPACCGQLYFDDLQVPEAVYSQVPVAARCIDYASTIATTGSPFAPRSPSAHKGDFGHVLVVGGDLGMGGAARMAAEAAARVGAGLVSVATRVEHAGAIFSSRPELMVHGIDSLASLTPLLERASVIAIGPGLGQGDWGRTGFTRILDKLTTSALPLVIDADGLNLLALEPAHYDHWVLTPHPGEAARLLGISSAEVQADRFAAARVIQQRYGGVCILKGAGTLVQSVDDDCRVCSDGNPGMASGGMGDVLTGVIAGLLAQGFEPEQAAAMAVCIHAHAADIAAREGERGMLASDLMPVVRRLVNPVDGTH